MVNSASSKRSIGKKEEVDWITPTRQRWTHLHSVISLWMWLCDGVRVHRSIFDCDDTGPELSFGPRRNSTVHHCMKLAPIEENAPFYIRKCVVGTYKSRDKFFSTPLCSVVQSQFPHTQHGLASKFMPLFVAKPDSTAVHTPIRTFHCAFLCYINLQLCKLWHILLQGNIKTTYHSIKNSVPPCCKRSAIEFEFRF